MLFKMLSCSIIISFLASLSSAQNTVSLFIPWRDSSVVASIITSDATATTYLVGCQPTATTTAVTTTSTTSTTASATTTVISSTSSDVDSCGFAGPFSLTEGPSTVHYSFSFPAETISLDCSLNGTTYAYCTRSIGGPSITYNGILSTAISGARASSFFIPVTLVTDASQIRDAGVTSTVRGSIIATSTRKSSVTGSRNPTEWDSGPILLATGQPTGVGSTPGAFATSRSKAGMPHITANAGLVVGGMAAVAAFAGL